MENALYFQFYSTDLGYFEYEIIYTFPVYHNWNILFLSKFFVNNHIEKSPVSISLCIPLLLLEVLLK